MFSADWDENPPDVALRLLLRQMEKENLQLSPEMAKAYENACGSFPGGRFPKLTRPKPTLKDYARSITIPHGFFSWIED